MINNTCSMISMDVLTRNHKHSKILAQMSFGKRPKKDAREVQASISPFASITFHTSIAWQRWWVKKRRLYQTMVDLSKQSAWEWVENPRHRILQYFTYNFIQCKGGQYHNTWMISTKIFYGQIEYESCTKMVHSSNKNRNKNRIASIAMASIQGWSPSVCLSTVCSAPWQLPPAGRPIGCRLFHHMDEILRLQLLPCTLHWSDIRISSIVWL